MMKKSRKEKSEPLREDSLQTCSKWPGKYWLLIGQKIFCIFFCSIGEQQTKAKNHLILPLSGPFEFCLIF